MLDTPAGGAAHAMSFNAFIGGCMQDRKAEERRQRIILDMQVCNLAEAGDGSGFRPCNTLFGSALPWCIGYRLSRGDVLQVDAELLPEMRWPYKSPRGKVRAPGVAV